MSLPSQTGTALSSAKGSISNLRIPPFPPVHQINAACRRIFVFLGALPRWRPKNYGKRNIGVGFRELIAVAKLVFGAATSPAAEPILESVLSVTGS